MTESDSAPNQPEAPTRSSTGLLTAVGGLLVTLSGPVVYLLALDHPFLRRTGLLLWILMGAGVVLACRAARRSNARSPWIPAGLSIGLVAFSLYGFYGFAALPKDVRFEQLTVAPDFVLPDQDGQPVALADLRPQGRVLLVFTRGFW